MERQQQLLAAYQQIYSLSSQMIALAQTGRWEELVELEFAYVTAVEKTAAFTGQAGPSMALQEMLRNKLQHPPARTWSTIPTASFMTARCCWGNHRSDKIDNTDENGLNSTMRYYSRVTLGY